MKKLKQTLALCAIAILLKGCFVSRTVEDFPSSLMKSAREMDTAREMDLERENRILKMKLENQELRNKLEMQSNKTQSQ